MKIVFDTNVYIAEALLGSAASEMIDATERAGWRVFVSAYMLDELERVLTEGLGFGSRLATLTRRRIRQRANFVALSPSRHLVPDDANDTPILQTALEAGADYLVTNDRHLLDLDPYEGLRIVSMRDYRQMLVNDGLLET